MNTGNTLQYSTKTWVDKELIWNDIVNYEILNENHKVLSKSFHR